MLVLGTPLVSSASAVSVTLACDQGSLPVAWRLYLPEEWALDPVRHHHEHFDGSGYPAGLAGEEISLGGRILAAADTYDALTSKRAWREPMSPPEAVAFLEERSGTLLDPEVFAALRAVVTRRKTLQFLDPSAG